PVWHQAIENFAPFHTGTGVTHINGLTTGKFAFRLLWRARTIALNGLGAQNASCRGHQQNRKNYFLQHEHPPSRETMLAKKPASSIASSSNIQRAVAICCLRSFGVTGRPLKT